MGEGWLPRLAQAHVERQFMGDFQLHEWTQSSYFVFQVSFPVAISLLIHTHAIFHNCSSNLSIADKKKFLVLLNM